MPGDPGRRSPGGGGERRGRCGGRAGGTGDGPLVIGVGSGFVEDVVVLFV